MSSLDAFLAVTGGGPPLASQNTQQIQPPPQQPVQAQMQMQVPVAQLPPDDGDEGEQIDVDGDGDEWGGEQPIAIAPPQANSDSLSVEDDGGCTVPPSVPSPPPAAAPAPVQAASAPPAAVTQQLSVATASPGVDFMAAMNGSTKLASTPAPVATVAPAAVAPPPAAVVAPPQPPAPPAAVEPAATPFQPASSGIKSLDEYTRLSGELFTRQRRLANRLGLVVLEDPKFCDPQNVVHVAIYNMRWNPMGLVRMSAQDLCVYESALSAHQVYVQAQQNEWRAKFEFLGKERERVLREVRGQFRGDTEKAKEDAAIAQNAAVGKLHYEFVEAQAMATFLTDMGDRFSQLEDGLKRLISLRHDEERRTYIQGKFTT